MFYCAYHITRFVESRNSKFLENDLISGSDQLKDLGFEIDYIESQPSTSSERLVVIHSHQVQRDDEKQMTDIPQHFDRSEYCISKNMNTPKV